MYSHPHLSLHFCAFYLLCTYLSAFKKKKKKSYYCTWKNTYGAFGCLGIGALFTDILKALIPTVQFVF